MLATHADEKFSEVVSRKHSDKRLRGAFETVDDILPVLDFPRRDYGAASVTSYDPAVSESSVT